MKSFKKKCVSFQIKRNTEVSVKGRALKERVNEADKFWYSSDEIKAFKSQVFLEVIKFRQEINTRNMKGLSPFDSWANSQLEMKTALLSELDNNKLPSTGPKTNLCSTSCGLESCIFHQHKIKKNLAIREILRYHKKSEALIKSYKPRNSDSKKRLKKIAAHQLALISLKNTTWAKQAALKVAQLNRNSIEANQDHGKYSRIKKEEIKSIDHVLECLNRKRYQEQTISDERKRPRRNAISLVNLAHSAC